MDITTTGKIVTANVETAMVMCGNNVVWEEENFVLYEFYDYEIPNSPYFTNVKGTNKYFLEFPKLHKVGLYALVRDKTNWESNPVYFSHGKQETLINLSNQFFVERLTDKYAVLVFVIQSSEFNNSEDKLGINLYNLNVGGKNYLFKLNCHYAKDDIGIKEEDVKAIADYLKDK